MEPKLDEPRRVLEEAVRLGREEGRLAEALTVADRALGMFEAAVGPDHLEIAVNAGDAARMLGLGRGAKVSVRLV